MRFALHLTLLFLAVTAQAQTPISQARALPIGTTVTVRGIITNGSELGSIRYLQDATAGIALFPGTGSIGGFAPSRGSDVTVTGTLKLFNGLLEINPVTAFTIHTIGLPDPTALTIGPTQIGEATESEVVRINGCSLANGGAAFNSGTHAFSSSSGSGVIYLRSGHPLIGSTIPSGFVDLTGIVSQYSTASPPVGGYQLLIRATNDMTAPGSITLVSGVGQSNINPAGFTLGWNTNVPGSSQVQYGTTGALGQFAGMPGSNSAHSVALEGLEAATMYSARVFSVLGTDTAWSPIGVYSTASEVPGSIIAYFNEPVDASVAIGPSAIDLGSAIDDTLRAYIDRAQISLDIAVYNTTNASIVNAVNDARDRGVQVRWITEGSTSNSALSGLHSQIPVLYRQNSSGSGMHNKFIIADADDPASAHVITGSCNFTNASFFLDANDLVIVNDQALARAYRMEFNEMWGDTGPSPSLPNMRFGGDKSDDTPHLFNIGGTLVESWFSPSDGTTGRIHSALNTADERIEFALFAFTMNTLASALIELDGMENVVVRGIIEEDDMDQGLYQNLLTGGVDVRPDGSSNLLHHKYAIVDHAVDGSDPLVIVGSHNWSFNAETHNDENTLIIHSASIADQFHQEWQARWTTAVAIAEQVEGPHQLVIYPDPASNWIAIMGLPSGMNLLNIAIIDLSGRVVLATTRTREDSAIDITGLAAGNYMLRLVSGTYRAEGRFIRLP